MFSNYLVILCILERAIILKDKSYLVEEFKYNLNILTTEMLQSLKTLSEIATLSRQEPVEAVFRPSLHFLVGPTAMPVCSHWWMKSTASLVLHRLLGPASLRCQRMLYLITLLASSFSPLPSGSLFWSQEKPLCLHPGVLIAQLCNTRTAPIVINCHFQTIG